MKIFNTLSREKEELIPINGRQVGMYTCGPTVYNFAHIGNLRTYVFEDTLRRALIYNNFELKHVMNITDVGHLTSDADEGEDKMLKGAEREHKTVWQIAEAYTKAFMDDCAKLNIQQPDIICKATDHIPEMIELIKRIEKNGLTYISEGNVYFDITKFPDYGELTGQNIAELQAGARIEVDKNKRTPHDFVLWFTNSKFKNQDMQWDSPWGRGFPGWHIECSAMSIKYLGEQFEIHCGGIDHIPVHHTNEIAQSEGATGKKSWVKYWMHGEFLVLKKKRMAKSGGNFITMQTLIEKGYDPLVYRYLCFTAHYRSPLKFSWETLDNAKASFVSLKKKVIELKNNPSEVKGDESRVALYQSQFLDAINDDLNLPVALALMWTMLKDNELGAKEKLELMAEFDQVFGFMVDDWKEETLELTEDIKELVRQREEARKGKDFNESDRIRDELKAKGIILEDTPQGVRWKKLIILGLC
jgi:cysteinyl-tRNA synthetase